ncbi:MAG: hypothetical protein QM733_22455 [Ilumatobacteraceae bacterium]
MAIIGRMNSPKRGRSAVVVSARPESYEVFQPSVEQLGEDHLVDADAAGGHLGLEVGEGLFRLSLRGRVDGADHPQVLARRRIPSGGGGGLPCSGGSLSQRAHLAPPFAADSRRRGLEPASSVKKHGP